MSGLCSDVTNFAWWFLLIALILAVAETVAAIIVKLKASRHTGDKGQATLAGTAMGPILEGLAKVLGTLKDLPAWVAIFLAGLALVWTAATAPLLCT